MVECHSLYHFIVCVLPETNATSYGAVPKMGFNWLGDGPYCLIVDIFVAVGSCLVIQWPLLVLYTRLLPKTCYHKHVIIVVNSL